MELKTCGEMSFVEGLFFLVRTMTYIILDTWGTVTLTLVCVPLQQEEALSSLPYVSLECV